MKKRLGAGFFGIPTATGLIILTIMGLVIGAGGWHGSEKQANAGIDANIFNYKQDCRAGSQTSCDLLINLCKKGNSNACSVIKEMIK